MLALAIPLLAVAYLSAYFLKFQLPWGLNTVLNLGVFFYIGYLLKEFDALDCALLKKCMIFILAVGLTACFLNGPVGYVNYDYGKFTLTALSSVCLSLPVIFLSKIIRKNRILEYIGKNTLGILVFHKLIVLIFQTKAGVLTKWMTDSNVAVELALCLAVTAIAVAFSLGVNKVLKTVAPFTVGERRDKKRKVKNASLS